MIGFLLPKLAWLALFALGPVVIHLLNRIRLRRVEFSSLQFLHEVKRERFNWLRLKEILLLIARTAVLLFLFLGLSRPFLKTGLFGVRREVSAVLILDDSYSMSYGGTADRMIQEARSYLSQLTGTSEAAVITAGSATSHQGSGIWDLGSGPRTPTPDARPLSGVPRPSPLAPSLSRDIKRLISTVDSTTITSTGVDLAAAVEQARTLLADATLPQKEIVIFTDLQKRAVAPIGEATNAPRPSPLTPHPSPLSAIPILLRDCGNGDRSNCAVTYASSREQLAQPGKPAAITARVRNFGNREETRIVTLRIDGATETQTVGIAPGEEKTIDFQRQVIDPGEHPGTVSIDHDSLTLDDERPFVVNIPARLPVLLAGDANDDLLFISRALAPDSAGYFDVATRLSADLRTADLRRYKVVGLINPATLTRFDWQRIDEYLNQGGSVFIALGREPADKTFLSRFANYQADMKPTGFVIIDKSDYKHPVLEAFEGRADLSIPRFFHYARMDPVNSNVIARLSDGSPYLIESKQARVIVAASDFRLDDNDLPLKAVFVPLVHRIFSYLGQEQMTRSYQVGDTITVNAPLIGLLKVKTPTGEYNLAPRTGGFETRPDPLQTRIAFGGTDTPGIYQLGENYYAVTLQNDESDLTRVSDAELTRKGITLLNDVRGRTSDLTNALLLLAGLFLAGEMIIVVV